MKRLLSTTAALSLAFAPIQPWPLLAQGVDLTMADDGRIVDADGTVLCVPSGAGDCDIGSLQQALTDAVADGGDEGLAAAIADLEAQAAAVAADQNAAAAIAQSEAEAQTAADVDAQAVADAEAQVTADAEAQAAADGEAQAIADADAQAAADAEAQATAAADAQAAADANAQAAADAEAQATAAADAQAAADAEAQATADANAQAAADAEAQVIADAEAQATADADAQAAADAEAQATADANAQAAADAEAQVIADSEAQATADADAQAAAADAEAAAGAEAQVAADAALQDEADAQLEADVPTQEPTDVAAETPLQPVSDEAEAALAAAAAAETPLQPVSDEAEAALAAAAAAEAEASVAAAATAKAPAPEPVDVPVVSESQTQSLTDLLTNTDGVTAAAVGAAAGLLAGASGNAPVESGAVNADAPADVTMTTVTEANSRASFQEFAAAPTVAEGGKKKSGLSDLEKAGLLALGALAVGVVLNNGREVVANTGDRVVVRNDQGDYQVYKDDDTLLRRPGSTVRTENYSDGSTRSIVARQDGTEVVTIRDASGRVLRRAAYDQNGNEVVLIDDTIAEQRIDVSTLPRPREDRVTISTRDENAALKAALARAEAEQIGRAFSLRQIREIKEVRRLAATIDVENITFETNSAVIRTTEARKLADLGRLMADILQGSRDEVFLIEGHTDAVGSAVSNLTLSDRRAESVALALTEYFGIPPENLVVQGYGESDLRVASQADERLNRRVAVRVVTPLLRTAAR
jgi:outer membrane protein OmpA-like peptidoglycan-associated protein